MPPSSHQPSSSPPAPSTVQVSGISVQLSYTKTAPPQNDTGKVKKGGKAKTVAKTKNKEIQFTFEDASSNYLDFLSLMLRKHSYEKFTPVTNRSRFGIKIIIPPNRAFVFSLSQSRFCVLIICARKNHAIDIDTFSDYKEFVNQIQKNKPSKLTVFLDLNDVKKAAKVYSYPSFRCKETDPSFSAGMMKQIIAMTTTRVITQILTQ